MHALFLHPLSSCMHKQPPSLFSPPPFSPKGFTNRSYQVGKRGVLEGEGGVHTLDLFLKRCNVASMHNAEHFSHTL